MKKKLRIILGILLFPSVAFSQVGINNTDPKATIDITAKTTDGSKPEGIIAPRLTGDQIKAADVQYGSSQAGAIIYATAPVTTSSTKTAVITAAGYYYFDGSVWQKLSGSVSSASLSNNVIRRSGASYVSLAASDLTGFINTLTFITQAPSPSFTLSSLTAADMGKVLYIGNMSGSNFLINYTDDTSGASSYTMQNTRGATFIWGTNGWIRGSY